MELLMNSDSIKTEGTWGYGTDGSIILFKGDNVVEKIIRESIYNTVAYRAMIEEIDKCIDSLNRVKEEGSRNIHSLEYSSLRISNYGYGNQLDK